LEQSILGAVLVFMTQPASAQDVPSDPTAIKPVRVGTSLPSSEVQTLSGDRLTVQKYLGGKKAVLVFYRGGWCPYCNRHLAGLANSTKALSDMGFKLVGISSDLPGELKKSADKNKLTFDLLSDSKAELLQALGVAFRVDDGTYISYRNRFKVDLESFSGQKHHFLPVPSVLIVDEKGVIRFVHTNPDYKQRLSSEEILAAARKMGRSAQ
jgi:peroxiredoxin